MDLSVVIVNWNSCEYLRKCLASIAAHPAKVSLEIVVIDSGSFDGCAEMVAEQFPHVRFIQSRSNLGFARANNLAFGATTGQAVLFLNPDTELVGPALDVLYEALRHLPRAGLIGCKLLNTDGTVQSSCIQPAPTILNQLLGAEFLRQRWPTSRLWGIARLYDPGAGPHEVAGISGACALVKRDAFLQVGRFSEEYFMYAEDMDLSYKLRRAGYTNFYVPSATVVHHGGSSSNHAVSEFAAVMMREAIWRFLRKTRGGAYAFAYRVGMLMAAVARLAVLSLFSASGRGFHSAASWHKWLAVLRWGLCRDGIVRRYYPLAS